MPSLQEKHMKAFLNYLLSIPVFALLYLYTFIMVLVTISLYYLGMKNVGPVLRFWAVSLFLLMGKRVKAYGQNKVDKNGEYLVLANHASLFDIPALMTRFPKVTWFGHVRLTRIPFFRKLLKILNYIPRTSSGYRNTRTMLEGIISQSGQSTLVMFPEGTRTKNGELNHFHRGFVSVIRATGKDVLPVTLNGFFSLKPKTRLSIDFFAKPKMFIHEPVKAQTLLEKNDKEILTEIKNIIQSAYTLT